MNRINHALILGMAKDGTIEGFVDLSASGSAAKFKTLVSRTCADLRRRGLVVKIQTGQSKLSHMVASSVFGSARTSGTHATL